MCEGNREKGRRQLGEGYHDSGLTSRTPQNPYRGHENKTTGLFSTVCSMFKCLQASEAALADQQVVQQTVDDHSVISAV